MMDKSEEIASFIYEHKPVAIGVTFDVFRELVASANHQRYYTINDEDYYRHQIEYIAGAKIFIEELDEHYRDGWKPYYEMPMPINIPKRTVTSKGCCAYCGRRINKEHEFCPGCGAPVVV